MLKFTTAYSFLPFDEVLPELKLEKIVENYKTDPNYCLHVFGANYGDWAIYVGNEKEGLLNHTKWENGKASTDLPEKLDYVEEYLKSSPNIVEPVKLILDMRNKLVLYDVNLHKVVTQVYCYNKCVGQKIVVDNHNNIYKMYTYGGIVSIIKINNFYKRCFTSGKVSVDAVNFLCSCINGDTLEAETKKNVQDLIQLPVKEFPKLKTGVFKDILSKAWASTVNATAATGQYSFEKESSAGTILLSELLEMKKLPPDCSIIVSDIQDSNIKSGLVDGKVVKLFLDNDLYESPEILALAHKFNTVTVGKTTGTITRYASVEQ